MITPRRIQLAAFGAAVAIATGVFGASMLSAVAPSTDGQPAQATLDQANPSNGQGGWGNAFGVPDGSGLRPYIRDLSVTNGGTTSPVITGGLPTAPAAENDLTAVVNPINVCATGQSSNCYAQPNRASIAVAYRGTGGPDDLHTDFSLPAAAATNPRITADSVIDMTIGLRTYAGTNLRWTWVNGEPLYWNYDAAAQTVHVRFHPATMPVGADGVANAGCSQIPVSTCTVTQSVSEALQPQILLSLDNTLSSGFAGSLFGSKSAYIGSLDGLIDPASPTQSTLTYGIAAPHLLANGGDRRGTLYGILSDSLLQSGFGITPSSFTGSEFSINRTSDSAAAGSDAVSWSAWSAGENGTAGRLLTISDISFSAPKFRVTRGSSAAALRKHVTVKIGRSRSAARLARDLGLRKPSGGRLTLKVRASSKKVCAIRGTAIKALRKGTCRYTVTAFTTAKKKAGSRSGAFTVTK